MVDKHRLVVHDALSGEGAAQVRASVDCECGVARKSCFHQCPEGSAGGGHPLLGCQRLSDRQQGEDAIRAGSPRPIERHAA
jgi:hypothetical protein